MPALSKKQQRFFGIVRAIQKGEMAPTTPETAKAAADMKKKDVKDFASTKHKGLPEKKVSKEEKDYDQKDVVMKKAKPLHKHLFKNLHKGDRKGDVNEEKHDDHAPEMIRNQLKTVARASKRIEKHTRKKDNFQAWVQSKITKASDYLDSAADYLDSENMKEELDKNDKPFVKKLVGKLRKGSKTHAKQADNLEKAMNEESNPRIPRKKGQPANSKKHSDLYTDENPKGTIHGLGFKDVATAKASVTKIRNSSRSHAHKIQAAVAMEQRAREMGKTSEAAVYRKYINTMKKKTKKMNEGWSDKYKKSIDCNNPKGFSQRAHCQGKKKVSEETKYDRYDKEKKQFAKADRKMKFGKFYGKAKEAKDRLRPGEVRRYDKKLGRYVSNKE